MSDGELASRLLVRALSQKGERGCRNGTPPPILGRSGRLLPCLCGFSSEGPKRETGDQVTSKGERVLSRCVQVEDRCADLGDLKRCCFRSRLHTGTCELSALGLVTLGEYRPSGGPERQRCGQPNGEPARIASAANEAVWFLISPGPSACANGARATAATKTRSELGFNMSSPQGNSSTHAQCLTRGMSLCMQSAPAAVGLKPRLCRQAR